MRTWFRPGEFSSANQANSSSRSISSDKFKRRLFVKVSLDLIFERRRHKKTAPKKDAVFLKRLKASDQRLENWKRLRAPG